MLPILTFHTLEKDGSPISLPPDVFEKGLAGLKAKGYRTISLLDIVNLVVRREPMPSRSFAITFDDGYQTVHSQAFPLLRKFGMTATVFLSTGFKKAKSAARLPSICDREMLSWAEVAEMHRGGFSFGAHTLTHADLTKLHSDQIEMEMHRSKIMIEDWISAEVTAFAYPFGRFTQRVREIASRHFTCACSTRLGLVTSKSDKYALERVETYYFRTLASFGRLASEYLPLYLTARNIPRRLRQFCIGLWN